MRINKPPVPQDKLLEHIQRHTTWAASEAEKYSLGVDAMRADSEAEARKKAGTCPVCHYFHRNRIGGAALTVASCHGCGEDMNFGSTATNDFCKSCSDTYQCCVQCGADLQLRAQRRVLVYKKPKGG